MAYSWRSAGHPHRTVRPWRRQRPPRWRRWGKWLSVAMLLVGGWAWAVWGWQFEDVEVQGATLVPNAEIRDVTLSAMERRRWGMVPQRSIILGGLRAMTAELKDQYALDMIRIERRWSTRPLLRVAERRIVAIARDVADNAVLLAEQGQVIGVASPAFRAAAGELLVLAYTDARETPRIGTPIIAESALTFLRALWGDLMATGGAYRPDHVTARGSSATEYVIHTVGGVAITVSASEETDRQREKLRAVLQHRLLPNPKNAARTIDVRYGDRVYLQ